jgi:hypothetical protein
MAHNVSNMTDTFQTWVRLRRFHKRFFHAQWLRLGADSKVVQILLQKTQKLVQKTLIGTATPRMKFEPAGFEGLFGAAYCAVPNRVEMRMLRIVFSQKTAGRMWKALSCVRNCSPLPTIFCNNFMLPKRRFWKPGKHFGPAVGNSVELTPILDKPAFSRIPLNSEPRIVVKIFGKFMLPKRRFLEPRNTFWTACLGTISRVWVLVLGDSCLKCAQKDGPKCFPGFQNLRLGSIKFERWLIIACDRMRWSD